MRGTFVTLEGGEHAGKSTQVAALVERARDAGIETITCREPGGTEIGERLRAALFGLGRAPTALTELLTFSAARAELVATVIQPALEGGASLVLCDRFTDSTVAYQGYGRGLDLDTIAAVNRAATGGLVPDLTVLLDVATETALTRQADGSDYLEREAKEFHERVRTGFLRCAEKEPERWLVLDGASERAAITSSIWERIEALLKR